MTLHRIILVASKQKQLFSNSHVFRHIPIIVIIKLKQESKNLYKFNLNKEGRKEKNTTKNIWGLDVKKCLLIISGILQPSLFLFFNFLSLIIIVLFTKINS